jgi:hypothetical protein
MADLTQFDLGSAARVARVVRAVEQEPRSTRPLTFGPVLEAGKKQIRLGRISSDWTSGETATVEKLKPDGDPFDPPVMFTAVNFFSTVRVPAADTVKVASGLVGGKWILLETDREIRIGRIFSDWLIGEEATIERLDVDGNPFDPPSTFTARNLCRPVHVKPDEEVRVVCSGGVLIEAGRGCTSQAAATELDDAADLSSSVDAILEGQGDGAQVLVNEQGCARWFRLAARTIVTDVEFVDGDLVKTTEDVYMFSGISGPSTSTIVSTTQQSTVTDVEFVDGDLVKTTLDVYVLAASENMSTSTIIGTTECPEPE